MGRCSPFLIACLGWLVLNSGCAGQPIRNPFAVDELGNPSASASAKRKPQAKSLAATGRGGKESRNSKLAKDKPSDPLRPAAGNSNSPAERKTVTQDAETLALIDRELRDATPEDRAALVAELKQVTPDMVRQILRVRRMALNSHQQQIAGIHAGNEKRLAAAQATSALQPDPLLATETRTVASAGLGPATPWAFTGQAGANPTAEQASLDKSPPGGVPANSLASQSLATATPGPNGTVPGTTSAVTSAGTLAPAGLKDQSPFGHSTATTTTANLPNAAAGGAPAPHAANQSQGTGASPIAAPLPAAAHSAGVLAQPASDVQQSLNGVPGQGMPAASNTSGAVGNLVPGNYDANALPPEQQRAVSSAPAMREPAVTVAALPVNGPGGVPGGVVPAGSQVQEKSWESYLQKVIDLTASEAAQMKPGATEPEKQAYIEKQVYLRMLYLMAGQQERALQAIAGLEPADQEFWQQTFWGIANYFDAKAIPAGADRATQTVAQLTTAIVRLQEKANLELRNVTFCHKISSFGNYERFPRDEFSPGQPILLYAEVGNFHSEPTADGQYRTILRSTLEIHKPGQQGDLVESKAFPATEDICRNHRRDYFHGYEYTIPPKISLGPHVLKLIVEDQLSRKIATYTLNFTVK